MPSALRQGLTKFWIRKEAERAALRAIHDDRGDSLAVSRQELERAKTLDDAMIVLGWKLVRGAEGNIRGIRYEAQDYSGNEDALFQLLAPYVEPGCTVDVAIEPDSPKRFKFTGRTCVERRIKPDEFRPYEEEEEAVPVSRVPVFADIAKTAPASKRKYAPGESFDPGEWIEHPKFGSGFVLKNAEAGKVRVLFADGERTMVQAKR